MLSRGLSHVMVPLSSANRALVGSVNTKLHDHLGNYALDHIVSNIDRTNLYRMDLFNCSLDLSNRAEGRLR